MFQITLDTRQVLAAIRRLERRAEDMTRPLRQCNVVARDEMLGTFEAQGDPPGSWAPLAESTLLGRLGRRHEYRRASWKLKESRRSLRSIQSWGRHIGGLRAEHRQIASRTLRVAKAWSSVANISTRFLSGEHKLLFDNGILRASVVESSETANGAVRWTTKRKTFIGSNLVYARTHQKGDHRTVTAHRGKTTYQQKRNIPARPFITITPGMKPRCIAVFADWFREAWTP